MRDASYVQQANLITENVSDAVQKEKLQMILQVESTKTDILCALKMVGSLVKSEQTTADSESKRKHK